MKLELEVKIKEGRERALEIIASAGLEGPVVFSHGQAQQALVLALARAHRWSRMLERGEVQSVNELAEQQGVDPSLVGRTLRLATLLAQQRSHDKQTQQAFEKFMSIASQGGKSRAFFVDSANYNPGRERSGRFGTAQRTGKISQLL